MIAMNMILEVPEHLMKKKLEGENTISIHIKKLLHIPERHSARNDTRTRI